MIVTIASGKGGTGKTTIAANLALLISNAQLLDCDVEEPNAHFFLKPEIKTSRKVFVRVPVIDESKCTFCGRCQKLCAFHALAVLPSKVLLFPELCHSCGVCSHFCPEHAISEEDREIGFVEIGSRGQLQFIRGLLNVGESMAPPLIREVKSYLNPTRTNIIDAPPGTACSMVESVRGSDYCLLVTEPTPFGLNDLKLATKVITEMKIPAGVVINRCDLGTEDVRKFCEQESIPVLMEIPFRREIAAAYAQGDLLLEKMPEYRPSFKKLWERIENFAAEGAA
ncbi:MAG: ATP-binding protein [Candidatus Omnitrophica bacterium]|nr:ATP-binding protein [Candidatus Omnitrophota bacterium]